MKLYGKIGLGVVLLAGLAAVLAATRPGPVKTGGDNPFVQRQAAPPSLTIKPVDEDTKRRARETLREIRKDRKGVLEAIASQPQMQDMEQRVQQHGMEATVHAGEKIAQTASGSDLPLQRPDWQNPVRISYRDMVLLHHHWLKHKSWPESEVKRLNGAAVTLEGAIMPIDPPGQEGLMRRFWLANPVVVMAGCVFCTPPTMADIAYVEKKGPPLKVDREQLYRSVVIMTLKGRFFLGPRTTPDGVQYLFGFEFQSFEE